MHHNFFNKRYTYEQQEITYTNIIPVKNESIVRQFDLSKNKNLVVYYLKKFKWASLFVDIVLLTLVT